MNKENIEKKKKKNLTERKERKREKEWVATNKHN